MSLQTVLHINDGVLDASLHCFDSLKDPNDMARVFHSLVRGFNEARRISFYHKEDYFGEVKCERSLGTMHWKHIAVIKGRLWFDRIGAFPSYRNNEGRPNKQALRLAVQMFNADDSSNIYFKRSSETSYSRMYSELLETIMGGQTLERQWIETYENFEEFLSDDGPLGVIGKWVLSPPSDTGGWATSR